MSFLLLLSLTACHGPDREAREPSALLDVAETGSFRLPGLRAPAMVIRTEADVPHVYANDREDLARVQGFVLARDRYFVMDMARRLALGELSEVLGDAALGADQESRGSGMRYVADRIDANLSEEHARILEAYAAGINAYVDGVRAGTLPAPSEYELAKTFLGASSAAELMQPFERHDIAAIGATLVYELGYETGDVGRAQSYAAIDDYFDGQPLGELRQAGLTVDIWDRLEPLFPVASAHGWGTEGDVPSRPRSRRDPGRALPEAMADRVQARFDRLERRLGHDHEHDAWGSNAWAVMGSHSSDGRALLAGDGHLPLSVPSLFYQIGLDTQELGAGDTHQVGLVFPGMPFLAVGTNGRVAWSQTQLMGDITDWYREQLQLGDDGEPTSSYFQGEWMPLQRFEETYVIADVPLLESVGRTETWARWTTFDGRWIADIEGRTASADEVLGAGEALVNVQGDLIVPGDTDGDGVITALSFDYTGFEAEHMLAAVDGFGHSSDVSEFRESTRRLVAYSQNITVADSEGSVLYTGYQGVPCREYLERDADGLWLVDSDPSMLLDGTRYGGFTVPIADGFVDETSDDAYACVVPFDVYPQAVNPSQGYVATANNDPGGIALDGAIHDDPWYIGGPWTEGYRADTIDQRLAAATAAGTADLDEMASIQADTRSRTGEHFVPFLLEAIAAGRAAASDAEAGEAEQRLAELYQADPEAIDEVAARLRAWSDGGFATPSGVETFYGTVEDGELEDAVATTIFNTWIGHFLRGALDDEGFPGVWRPSGSTGRLRLILRMIDGRGADNPLGMASWNPETAESAYWDVLATEPVETSDEIALSAMLTALDALRAAPSSTGQGGFGTDDMDQWLWGLRHWVHFDSILAEFLSGDEFSFIADQFSITPDVLPLDDDIGAGDPRRGLPGFPRPGDNFAVDAANPGLSGSGFDYGSGPVFRMVIALGPEGVEGRNILPGGQSGLNDSAYFADQAALWLGNETLPMRFTVAEVVEGAVGRETYLPEHPLP